MPQGIRPKDALALPLYGLLPGPGRTTSHALHAKTFVGRLNEWHHFIRDAEARWQNMPLTPRPVLGWRNSTTPHAASFELEHLGVGDENGVQGRFQANVSHIVSAVLRALGVPAWFGEWRAGNLTIPGGGPGPRPRDLIPDLAVVSIGGLVVAVAEVKTFWPKEHNLEKAMARALDVDFRHFLGQTAQYMFRGGLKYGMITTYNQTVFLRVVDRGGMPVLEHSGVVYHDDTHVPYGGNTDGSVTLRQAVYHFVMLAMGGHAFAFTINEAQWCRPL